MFREGNRYLISFVDPLHATVLDPLQIIETISVSSLFLTRNSFFVPAFYERGDIHSFTGLRMTSLNMYIKR